MLMVLAVGSFLFASSRCFVFYLLMGMPQRLLTEMCIIMTPLPPSNHTYNIKAV